MWCKLIFYVFVVRPLWLSALHSQVFYEKCEATTYTTCKEDILVILGDWNAKVGPNTYTKWKVAVDKFGIESINEREFWLLELTRLHKMFRANTMHLHNISRKARRHPPDDLGHHQSDSIVMSKRYQSSRPMRWNEGYATRNEEFYRSKDRTQREHRHEIVDDIVTCGIALKS